MKSRIAIVTLQGMLCFTPAVTPGGNPELLLDIHPSGTSIETLDAIAFGNRVLFSASAPDTGRELWITDGTTSGTRLVIDLVPGSLGSGPSNMIVANGWVYFSAYGGLWRTDGTAVGTTLVKAFSFASNGLRTACGGYLFIDEFTPSTGMEIWRTDGTEVGTVCLDLTPGPGSSDLYELATVGNEVFLSAGLGLGGELYAIDSQTGVIRMVKDIRPGVDGSTPRDFFVVGSKVFFSAAASAANRTVHVSDGTEAGTFSLGDYENPTGFVVVGSTVFFGASGKLYRTDGTPSGTQQVLGPEAASLTSPNYFAPNGDGSSFYFAATRSIDTELWFSDGTDEGTLRFLDINPTNSSSPSGLMMADDRLLFVADDGIHGRELWQSNGTPAGTAMIVDANPGSDSGMGNGSGFVITNDYVVFFARDSRGREPWVYRFDPSSANNWESYN